MGNSPPLPLDFDATGFCHNRSAATSALAWANAELRTLASATAARAAHSSFLRVHLLPGLPRSFVVRFKWST